MKISSSKIENIERRIRTKEFEGDYSIIIMIKRKTKKNFEPNKILNSTKHILE